MSINRVFSITYVIVIAWSCSSFATVREITWSVPAIRDAVEASADGDTIYVYDAGVGGVKGYDSSQLQKVIVLKDIDGDGLSELVVTSTEGEVSYWNTDGSRCTRIAPETSKKLGRYSLLKESTKSSEPGVPSMQPGWPKTLDRGVSSSPVLGNLTGDNDLEIVIGAGDDMVHVWDAYGNEQPGWPQLTQADVRSSPALGDIDGDGELEIVVGSWDRHIYAWNTDGTLVDGLWPLLTDGVIVWASPALGDIDDDDELEIVIACYYGQTTTLYALNGDGSDVDSWPLYFSESIYSTPALADIDRDGKLEILIGSRKGSDGMLYAFNGENATPVDGWPIELEGCIRECSPVVADIDNDDTLEIVIGTSYWGGYVWVFNADGSTQEGWPKDVGNNVISSPALADFDNDGDLEIVVATAIYSGSPNPGRMFIWHHNGEEAENWPWIFTGSFEQVSSSPVVADIDADGELEIVIATEDFTGLYPAPNLYAFNFDATVVNDSWPLVGEDISSTPALGDIDRDGQLELVVGIVDGYEVHCWELGDNTYPAYLPWPMFHHDRWHTGYFVQFSCGDVDGNNVVNVSDAVFLLAYIFAGGAAPEPLEVGDASFDGLVNISDVVYLISYIFDGGPEPCGAYR